MTRHFRRYALWLRTFCVDTPRSHSAPIIQSFPLVMGLDSRGSMDRGLADFRGYALGSSSLSELRVLLPVSGWFWLASEGTRQDLLITYVVPNSEIFSHPSRPHILCGRFNLSDQRFSPLIRLALVQPPPGRDTTQHRPHFLWATCESPSTKRTTTGAIIGTLLSELGSTAARGPLSCDACLYLLGADSADDSRPSPMNSIREAIYGSDQRGLTLRGSRLWADSSRDHATGGSSKASFIRPERSLNRPGFLPVALPLSRYEHNPPRIFGLPGGGLPGDRRRS